MSETPAISMTENAARRVAEIAVKLGKPPILRLSVEGGGCSGFQYRFGLADAVETDDIRAEGTGASLVVDPISLIWCAGRPSILSNRSVENPFRSPTHKRRQAVAADRAFRFRLRTNKLGIHTHAHFWHYIVKGQRTAPDGKNGRLIFLS
jgi:iron-sulfur cluster assembly accessory protein